MSCKVVTLGSNVEGLNEVICPEKALFEKGNEVQLAELIMEIDSDEELYKCILNKQQEQIANFDIETSLRKHLDVYNGK